MADKASVVRGTGVIRMVCKWLDEFTEICVNAGCPACADYCPCVRYPEICRYSAPETEPKENEL